MNQEKISVVFPDPAEKKEIERAVKKINDEAKNGETTSVSTFSRAWILKGAKEILGNEGSP